MKLLVVTLRPLNTRKFAKNATFHSSKFLKLKLSSHAIILCNFFLLNYTIFNCIKVICPRFSHILQFSVFLVLSVLVCNIHCRTLTLIVLYQCLLSNICTMQNIKSDCTAWSTGSSATSSPYALYSLVCNIQYRTSNLIVLP